MKDLWNKNALAYGVSKQVQNKTNNKKKILNKNEKKKDPWNKNAMIYGLEK